MYTIKYILDYITILHANDLHGKLCLHAQLGLIYSYMYQNITFIWINHNQYQCGQLNIYTIMYVHHTTSLSPVVAIMGELVVLPALLVTVTVIVYFVLLSKPSIAYMVTVTLPLRPASVVGLPLDARHITSELVTTWSVGTLQERKMEVAVMPTTLTIGSVGRGTEG